jgi:hypothetical protein
MEYLRSAIDWFVSLNSLFIIVLLIVAGLAALARWAWSRMNPPIKR